MDVWPSYGWREMCVYNVMFHGVFFFILFYHFFRFEYKKTKRKGCFSRWPFACTVIARSRRLLLIQIRLYFRAISSISPRQSPTIQYHIYIWPPELTATVKIRYDENFRIKKKNFSIYLTATTKITKRLFFVDINREFVTYTTNKMISIRY